MKKINLKIKYEDGEIRQITDDLNQEQAKSLINHWNNESGKMAIAKELIITRQGK